MEPTVTVIIPVLNAERWIEEVLRSLCSQTYVKENTEIIFVDNGSTDHSKDLIRKYPVKLLVSEGARNPYQARNRALEMASGEIIAFTDANKIPKNDWIEKGVDALITQKADLAGGDIQFRLDGDSGSAKIYDSITFNNNKMLAGREGAAVTGNLFVKRELFDVLDKFPENRRSGMDVWWTQRAVGHGFSLLFAEEAVVYCIPRNLTGVLKKSYRVGRFHPFNMQSSGMSVSAIFITSLKTFAPAKISKLKEQLAHQPHNASLSGVWMVAWFSKICMAAGRLHGLLELNLKTE